MSFIHKARREWFGGVVYSEHPGFTAFVDSRGADSLGIPMSDDLTEGLFSAPLDVHISITDRCNVNCRGCYARNQREPAMDMPLDLARAVIDRLAEMDVLTIALGGGEPFLHPDLFAIAEYSRSRGVVPNITTNGLVMDSTTAAACRAFGNVHVSCHHPDELSRLATTVRFLKHAGIDVGLNVLVSAVTCDGLPRIWRWAAKQGISRLLLLKFKLTEKNRDCRDMVLSPAKEQSLLPVLRRLSRRHPIMPMVDCAFFPALAWRKPKRRHLEFFDVNGCLGANAILAVTTDGRFKPCSFCPTSCGDALSLSRDLWKHSESLAEFRRQRLYEACGECTYQDLCNGGCRVAETPWCAKGCLVEG